MKALIDANVILDVLCNRKDFVADSLRVFHHCEAARITGYVSALSIPNIVYIMRKELDQGRIREILSTLTAVFTVADLREADLIKAAGMAINDYEDAVQSACAARLKVNYIITRNIRDYAESPVPAIKPAELFDRI